MTTLTPPPLEDDYDAPPPLDDDDDTSAPAGVPSTWSELRTANRALYNRARAEGLVRSTTDPSTLLDDDMTSSLTDHLNKVPNGPLPQPLALELDVADTVSQLLRGRVRWYRNEEAEQGGRWESWDGTRWDVTGPDEMETLVGRLIHPHSATDIAQLVRPVTPVKISAERAMELQAQGLLLLDSETKQRMVPDTTISVTTSYVPATDWTGKVTTVRNVVSAMRGTLLSKVPLDLDVEDPTRWNINLSNGHILELSKDAVVDPETGDLTVTVRPTARTDYVHKRTRAGWNPDTNPDPSTWSPRWRSFVRDVCSYYDDQTQQWTPRPDHERALQVLAGATLLPTPAAHRMGLLYGDLGNNGKSLFVDTLLDVFADYGYMLDPQPISRTANDPHPTDMMGMVGARMVAVHEMQRTKWDATKTKRQVTDKKVKARRMGQDMGSYTRTANLWITANETPSVTGDSGFWKRIVLFPFDARWYSKDDPDDLVDVSIGPEDTELMTTLLTEADEILLWMLEGLHTYYTQGLVIPETMQERKSDAKGSASEWVLFLDDHVEFTDDPTDVLDDKLIWDVWKEYVDRTLQGKFTDPSAPGKVEHAFLHAYPKAKRRGRGRIGGSARERNGFSGVKWTALAVGQFGYQISSYTAKVSGQPTLTSVPLMGGVK